MATAAPPAASASPNPASGASGAAGDGAAANSSAAVPATPAAPAPAAAESTEGAEGTPEGERGIAPIPRDPRTGKFLSKSKQAAADAAAAAEGTAEGDEGDDGEGIDLPGVIDHAGTGDGIFDFESMTEPPDTAPEPPASELAADQADQADPADQAAEEALEEGEKFRFADAEWDSQEKAEESFRTLRGMFKSMESRTEQFKTVAQTNLERVQEWEAFVNKELPARDQYISQLQGILRQHGVTVPGAPATTAVSQAASQAVPQAADAAVAEFDPVKAIDWGFVARLREERGEDYANAYLVDQLHKGMSAAYDSKLANLQAKLDAIAEPYRESEETAAAYREADNLIQTVVTYTNEDGSPFYPELQSTQHRTAVLSELGAFAEKSGFTPEQILTPRGFHIAMLAYRDWKRVTGNAIPGLEAGPADPAPNPNQPSQSRVLPPEALAAGDAVPDSTPRARERHEPTIEDQIRASMEQSPFNEDTGFAFE